MLFISLFHEYLSGIPGLAYDFTEGAVAHSGGIEDNRFEEGEVYLSLAILPDRVVRVTVKDKGCGIEDVARARTPLFTTDPAGERSGMGFSVMEAFSDRLTVKSRPGKGTKVTFYKKMK